MKVLTAPAKHSKNAKYVGGGNGQPPGLPSRKSLTQIPTTWRWCADWRSGWLNKYVRWADYRWNIYCPVPSNWYVIRDAIDNHNVGKARRQLVLEQDQAVGRTENASASVPLRDPVTCDRVVTGVAKLHGVVGEDAATAANRVRQQEQLAGWTIHAGTVKTLSTPIARQALVAGDAEHHHIVGEPGGQAVAEQE